MKQLKLSIAYSDEPEDIVLVLASDDTFPEKDAEQALGQTARTLARAIVFAMDLRMYDDFLTEIEWAFDDLVGTMNPTWEKFVLEED